MTPATASGARSTALSATVWSSQAAWCEAQSCRQACGSTPGPGSSDRSSCITPGSAGMPSSRTRSWTRTWWSPTTPWWEWTRNMTGPAASRSPLAPLRPWKSEQLGGGYAVSSWCERVAVESAAAIIAVSGGMRSDVLVTYPSLQADRVHVIRNGIDTDEYAPDDGTEVLERYGIDPNRPMVVYVGRVTRQKGLPVLLRAGELLDPDVQLVLCAGQADTEGLAAEVTGLAGHLREHRSGVVWLN